MEETLSRMRKVDRLCDEIALNVDRMSALADDEIMSVLRALDAFVERFRERTNYLRPDPEE